jgi:hypothetical protein
MKGVAEIIGPDVEPHDDAERIIGRRTTYDGDEHRYLHGYDVVIVAVMKGALLTDRGRTLTTEDEIHQAGGVSADDRIEVAPVLPEEGRLSFVTSDPRAIDLECFRHLARGGTTH